MAEFSSAEQRALEAWVDQHAQARQQITEAAADFAERLTRELRNGAFYNDSLVDEVGEDIAAAVRDAQEDVAELTSLFFDEVLEVYGSESDAVVDLPERLREVDPVEEWRRPAEQYRYSRSLDIPEPDAVDRAVDRARQLVEMDSTLAFREASRQKLVVVEEIRGYRRILRPELAKSQQSCGLCVAAADRFYYVDDLLPIHNGCNCGVMPVITGKPDPRNVEGLYAQVAAAATGNSARELSEVRVRIRENGEIGPVLTAEGESFRGPDDVAVA